MTVRDASAPSPLRVDERPPLEDGPAAGRLAVLVHGSLDRGASFTRLAGHLPDWTVLTYDRRGYEGSLAIGPPGDFSEQVDDLLDVLAGRPAVAFGHSYGGNVVLAAAARAPELVPAALVWEPPQPWQPWWPGGTRAWDEAAGLTPAERAEWFVRRIAGDRIWERLPPATQARRRAEGPTLAAELDSLTGDALLDTSAVTVPVLVGRGTRSAPPVLAAMAELAATLARGELVEVEGAGHGAHLSHPGEVAALLHRAAGLA